VSKTWKDAAASAGILEDTRSVLSEVADWTLEGTEAALRSLAERRGVAPGKVFQPLRLAVTGITVSPGIGDVLLLLGRERTLRRLDEAVAWLRQDGAEPDR
jgi:glutamyl-tRNA synthetase